MSPARDAPRRALKIAATPVRSPGALLSDIDVLVACAEQVERVWSPERHLVLAILEDALRCVLGGSARAKELHDEARRWIASDAEELPGAFSFVRCCEATGLDPHYVRAALRRRTGETLSGYRTTGRSGTGNATMSSYRLPKLDPRRGRYKKIRPLAVK